jgi:hypothetical protein
MLGLIAFSSVRDAVMIPRKEDLLRSRVGNAGFQMKIPGHYISAGGG